MEFEAGTGVQVTDRGFIPVDALFSPVKPIDPVKPTLPKVEPKLPVPPL